MVMAALLADFAYFYLSQLLLVLKKILNDWSTWDLFTY